MAKLDPNYEAFIEQWSSAAMEEMLRSGVPASVTLAQALCESGCGRSWLSVNANNFFGIKAQGNGWIESGRPYVIRSDDKTDDKFRKYDNPADSFRDHSNFLTSNPRYSKCFENSPTDYESWVRGIKAAGYATDANYVNTINGLIKSYDLSRFDQAVVKYAEEKGITIGSTRGEKIDYRSVPRDNTSYPTIQMFNPKGVAHLPLDGDFKDGAIHFTQTCPFRDTKYHNSPHNGIDLRAQQPMPIYATEDNGKVISASHDKRSGNKIWVQYTRPDGSTYDVGYLHLSKMDVKKGDTVQAGQIIGMTGNSGINKNGKPYSPHLDFRIRENTGRIDANGNHIYKYLDPKDYLVELGMRSGNNVAMTDKETNKEVLGPVRERLASTLLAANAKKDQEVIPATEHRDPSKQLDYSDDPVKQFEKMLTSGSLFSGGDLMGNIAQMLLSMMIAYATKSFTSDRKLTAMEQQGKDEKPKEVPSKEEESVMRGRRDEKDAKVSAISSDSVSMGYDAVISQRDTEDRNRQQSAGMSMG